MYPCVMLQNAINRAHKKEKKEKEEEENKKQDMTVPFAMARAKLGGSIR